MEMSQRLSISLVLLFLLVACSDKNPTGGRPDPKIEWQWRRNEEIVQAALSGKSNLDENFDKACIFFERLTGISISGDMTFEGFVPSEQAPEDFARIKIWYKKNQRKLCWNSEISTVELCRRKSGVPG